MQLLDQEHIVDHLILDTMMKYIINQAKAFISKPNDTSFKVFFLINFEYEEGFSINIVASLLYKDNYRYMNYYTGRNAISK